MVINPLIVSMMAMIMMRINRIMMMMTVKVWWKQAWDGDSD